MRKTLALVAMLLLVTSTDAFASAANSFSDKRAQTAATITVATNATTSAEVDLGGTEIVGIQMPAAFTGTAITFLVSTVSGGTYQPLVDGTGSSVSKTVAASKYVGIDPTLFHGIRFVKIVSGSSEGADRVFTIISRP
jgi:hypothetical protein